MSDEETYTKGNFSLTEWEDVNYCEHYFCKGEDVLSDKEVVDLLDKYEKENEWLKHEIQEYREILQDMGLLMSDEEVINIRNDIADKLLKPLFKSNGFDVDIDTTDGFNIIPKNDFNNTENDSTNSGNDDGDVE